MIGGNTYADIKVIDKNSTTKNRLGENEKAWKDAIKLKGWLDMGGNTSSRTIANAKTVESTHIFLCDYVKLVGITASNAKVVIDGNDYELLFVDDPMNMHEHLEIYLKQVV